mgnify:CR=1 FL=1
MNFMTISGLARSGAVGVETVRFYQRLGLLDTPDRPKGSSGEGRTRRYGDEHVRKLRFIRSAKSAGFTLEQIKELIALDATKNRARAHQMARERIDALDARIADLESARKALLYLANGPCPIIAAFEQAAN